MIISQCTQALIAIASSCRTQLVAGVEDWLARIAHCAGGTVLCLSSCCIVLRCVCGPLSAGILKQLKQKEGLQGPLEVEIWDQGGAGVAVEKIDVCSSVQRS
jgi:hypothetical protein